MKDFLTRLIVDLLVIFLQFPIQDKLLKIYNSREFHAIYLLLIEIVIIILLSLFLLDFIGLFKKKANIFIRIFNRFYYPRYIKHKDYIWRVSINNKNRFLVDDAPFCKKCDIKILKTPNEWDGFDYHCNKCGNNFNDENFEDDKRSIEDILETDGIGYFEGHSKKRRKVINSKC